MKLPLIKLNSLDWNPRITDAVVVLNVSPHGDMGFADFDECRKWLTCHHYLSVRYHHRSREFIIPIEWIGDGEPIPPRLGLAQRTSTRSVPERKSESMRRIQR